MFANRVRQAARVPATGAGGTRISEPARLPAAVATVSGARPAGHRLSSISTEYAEAGNAVAQRILTRPESAAGDMLHRDRADIFEAETLDYPAYKNIRTAWYASLDAKQADLADAIEDDRSAIDYKRMSGATMDSYNDALAMVGDNREHMYAHMGTTIYRGDRTREKLPHPALIGYDPDVIGAGTLRATYSAPARQRPTLRIKVTNSSGHFRPDEVDETTRARVEAKARVGKPGNTRLYVDIQNV